MAALVYLIIGLLATTLAAAQTYGNVQWFSTAYNLDLRIDHVAFRFNMIGPAGVPYGTVTAHLYNPGGFDGLNIFYADYTVYVNSTSQPFLVQGSTEVGTGSQRFQQAIPSHGNLNVTSTFDLFNDTLSKLVPFVNALNQTDLQVYIGANIHLQSAYGPYIIPYCYQLPSNLLVNCPGSRIPSRPMPRVGGG